MTLITANVAPTLNIPVSSDKKDKNELVERLLKAIKDNRITITEHGETLSDEQVRAVLEKLVPGTATIIGGFYDRQIQLGMAEAEKLLNTMNGRSFTRKNFLWNTAVTLTLGTIEDDILQYPKQAVGILNGKRETLRDKLQILAAELKVFGVIQAEVSRKLAAKENLWIQWDSWWEGALNLFDPALYGYKDKQQLIDSPEGKFLARLCPDVLKNKGYILIHDFLNASGKRSGRFDHLSSEYKHDKDPNPLANFATMLSDRTRPVQDESSLETTKLSEVSSEYTSAIETYKKIIEKLNEVIQNIIRSI